jgi:hypothetical protein
VAELAVPEARAWHRQWHGQVLTGAQVGVKGNVAEGDDYLHIGQQAQLSEEVWLAVVHFLALGFVRRGRTVQHLRDETVVEPQIVVAMRGGGLIGKAVRV